MLRRLRLSTKLALIVMIGLIGTSALGITGARERTDRWQTATALPDVIGAETALLHFRELVNREATLSAWYVATGEPTTRRALAEARPATDRAARALGRSQGAARPRTAPVERAWRALRVRRASIDRRLISDTAALSPFDRVDEAVRRALDASGAATGDSIASVDRTRIGVSDLDTAMAREQSALVIAIARASVASTLLDRIRVAAADQRRLRDPVLASARRELGRRGSDAIAAVRSALPPVRTIRTPALRGFVPFVTPRQWVTRSDAQLHALEALGRSLDTTAAARAQARVDATRAAMVRWFALAGGVLATVAIAGLALRHAILSADRAPVRVGTGGPSEDPIEDPVEVDGAAGAPEPAVPPPGNAPPLPRRRPTDHEAPPPAPLEAPATRGPGEVFELVARFEAGLRRADRDRDDSDRDDADTP